MRLPKKFSEEELDDAWDHPQAVARARRGVMQHSAQEIAVMKKSQAFRYCLRHKLSAREEFNNKFSFPEPK